MFAFFWCVYVGGLGGGITLPYESRVCCKAGAAVHWLVATIALSQS